ncbi:sodium-dependent transporter [Alkalilimnicola ehrlichii MLHE-1]|uniref:Transporter n=1 Tax=Alkalilimnicola ehrlichii (strain ATCC BAA-1101 / DSM 17681 / MLHE-1) TaxID=187272 RepID=Q0A4P9_ALKEH|nr:sodium-dependent transporter [Alkalilimnicola ehrlichii]ABI58188.1 sodium:neurotransmitter symporter [Alkalilimnicola ehrlichii MLHE-1]
MARSQRTSIHGQWGSRWAFILAATGSAVGLGNIWRFPYVVGESGGGAFVVVYLLFVLGVGIPVMMGEILLGRHGRQSPINTLSTLCREYGTQRAWVLLGWMGVLAGFIILSFYSVVAGWSLAYVPMTAGGAFLDAGADRVGELFAGLLDRPLELVLWHSVFMALCFAVVSRGVRSGLEKAVRFLMPALFLLLILLVGYGMGAGAFAEAMRYLFLPDLGELLAGGEAGSLGALMLGAVGQAFFTLSLGMGAIMVYGSYLSSRSSIPQNSVIIAGADTAIALIAGLAVFPIVFAVGLEPDSGAGLVFITLSAGFGQMPAGALFGTLFFVLLSFAAWTSAISIMEPATAYLVENRGWSRRRAAAVVALAAWAMGILSALSLNVMSGFSIAGMGFMDLMEFLTFAIMLPLGGLLVALYVGWVLPRRVAEAELQLSHPMFSAWLTLIRWLVPLAIVLVFLNALGVF